MTPEAQLFLKGIQGRTEFHEILGELRPKKPPIYRPVRTNDSDRLDADHQTKNWYFDSGVYSENIRILTILSGEAQ